MVSSHSFRGACFYSTTSRVCTTASTLKRKKKAVSTCSSITSASPGYDNFSYIYVAVFREYWSLFPPQRRVFHFYPKRSPVGWRLRPIYRESAGVSLFSFLFLLLFSCEFLPIQLLTMHFQIMALVALRYICTKLCLPFLSPVGNDKRLSLFAILFTRAYFL